MIQLFKMAWRDLGRNRRRSFLSALALGLGLALLMTMAAIVDGEFRGSMDLTIQLQSGHLQVRAPSYDEGKTSLAWEDLVENPDAIAAQIAALPEVQVATPRLFASGVLAAGAESVGVRIVGIDPPSEANAPFRDGLVGGEFLNADDRTGVLIGQPLAEEMNLGVGDPINLLVNTSNGDVDEQVFTIRGVYSTRTPTYDEGTLFMPLAKAQAITRAEKHASSIFVLLQEREQTGAVVATLKAGNGPIANGALQLATWEEMNKLLLEYEQFAAAYMVVLYLIILAITATVIVNTFVMAVFERTREIGILSAIGMRGRRIMAMFFAESSLLAVGGIAIGLVLGCLLVLYFTEIGFYIGDMGISGMLFGDRVYAHLTLNDTVTLCITAFVVALLAALYPAMLAARMDPVQALHGGK